jgi:anti-anti-sigma factor
MLENDWTIFDWARRADPGVLVELVGEIDVRYRRPIEQTLSHCLVSKRSKLVDLSEVKFMYSRWVRVLAFRYQRGGGRMPLSDAS